MRLNKTQLQRSRRPKLQVETSVSADGHIYTQPTVAEEPVSVAYQQVEAAANHAINAIRAINANCAADVWSRIDQSLLRVVKAYAK